MKTPRSKQSYEARARVAKALAHPSRLLILDLLQEGDRCVCDLTEQVGADQSTVSRHLAVLKHAGIVEDRKQDTRTFYSIRVPCLQGFWNCVDAVLEENLRSHRAACRR